MSGPVRLASRTLSLLHRFSRDTGVFVACRWLLVARCSLLVACCLLLVACCLLLHRLRLRPFAAASQARAFGGITSSRRVYRTHDSVVCRCFPQAELHNTCLPGLFERSSGHPWCAALFTTSRAPCVAPSLSNASRRPLITSIAPSVSFRTERHTTTAGCSFSRARYVRPLQGPCLGVRRLLNLCRARVSVSCGFWTEHESRRIMLDGCTFRAHMQ
jgi:hypothetical protein